MIHHSKDMRKKALDILKKHKISGANVYLIDMIPLIEMIWADGRAQEAEINILENYLEHHVNHINIIAGYEALTFEESRKFVLGFLSTRPDPELLKTLRELIPSIRLSSSDQEANELLQQSLLAVCLDIAASCVSTYPFGLSERFDPREKRCLFDILESLEK